MASSSLSVFAAAVHLENKASRCEHGLLIAFLLSPADGGLAGYLTPGPTRPSILAPALRPTPVLCGASPSHLSHVALCRYHGLCGIFCCGIYPLSRIRLDYPLPLGHHHDIAASPHSIHRVCADCVAVADSIFAPKAELHALKTITLTTRIEALQRVRRAGLLALLGLIGCLKQATQRLSPPTAGQISKIAPIISTTSVDFWQKCHLGVLSLISTLLYNLR